ncbi:MAG: hypothetical protein LJE97_11520 [Betaproteobacteria bacterium]|jgi:hypothetical protein|nr:hypothetical protein [Betaproteobacteria bacterium]
MQAIATVSKDTLKYARGTARNLVEAYRLVAHRGVAAERRAVSAGIGFVGNRLGTDGQVLAGLGRMNRDVTGFAGTVVDGVAEQATAVVDGVARVTGQMVVSGLGALPRRARPVVETVALPVARPVRSLSVRAEGASKQLLKLVSPKSRAKTATKRTVRKATKRTRRTR